MLQPPVIAAGFIRLSIQEALSAYTKFIRRISWWRIITRRRLDGSLEDCLKTLHPLRDSYTKALFVETAGDHTAFIVNDALRSGSREHVENLVKETRSSGLHVISRPEDRGSITPGAGNELQVYEFRGTEHGVVLRGISVLSEDSRRWDFAESGEPLPFEDPELYKASRIEDRLPTEVLDRYLQALGIRFYDRSFYLPSESSQAVLVRLCP